MTTIDKIRSELREQGTPEKLIEQSLRTIVIVYCAKIKRDGEFKRADTVMKRLANKYWKELEV